MLKFFRRRFGFLVLIFSFCFLMNDGRTLQAMESEDCLGTISLQLSRSLALILEHVSESIKALAEEYVRIFEATPPMEEAEKGLWMKRAFENGKTVSFRPFTSGPEPVFQAPVPTCCGGNSKPISISLSGHSSSVIL